MLNKKVIIGLILLLFLICGVASAFDLFGDGLEPDDIYISDFESEVNHYSDDTYMYDVFYTLENVSQSLGDSEVITYFYNEDKVVLSDEVDVFSNNTTNSISYDDIGSSNSLWRDAFLFSDNFTNITHVKIVLVKDGEILFNTTEPFDMENIEETDLDDLDNSKEADYATTFSNEDYDLGDDNGDSSSGDGSYVASDNSNIFHEPSCTHAKRIKDYNKITFSSRDEAINAGYEPCGVCYP